MSISNGQPVDAPNSNAAWISKNTSDVATGDYDLASVTPASGPTVSNVQREINGLGSFTGRSSGSAYNSVPTYSDDEVGVANESLVDRASAISDKFKVSGGHAHDGTAGNGAPIQSEDIINTPFQGFFLNGATLIGVTGGSTNVTTELTGKSPSNSATTLGVVVNAPYNRVILRDTSNQEIVNGSGDEIYGRVTESAGTWTLTYYYDNAGVETAYSFGATTDVKWYYQELFNPLDPATWPVYDPLAFIPSDSATADVIVATTALKGKVQLATTSQSVGAANSSGTANATVANADHVHQGVHSVSKGGGPALYGDVTISAGANVTLTQAGQDIQVAANLPAYRAGSDSISNGVTSKSVSFSSAFASTNYAVVATIRNAVDSNPMFIPVCITAKSTSGFTASWNTVTDSANYVLEWFAQVHG